MGPASSRLPGLGQILAGLAALAVGGGTVLLIVKAEDWGLVPEAARYLPWLSTFVKAGLAVVGGLVLTLLAGGLWWSRRARRKASLSLEALAMKQVAIIRERVYVYMRRYGCWPPTLAHVGLSEALLINPWGYPYRYVVHGDQFTIVTDMPQRLYDYLALESRWLGGPGRNLLTCGREHPQWH